MFLSNWVYKVYDMKTFLIIILYCFFINLHIYSQTPGWTWAQRAGSEYYDFVNYINCDLYGNVYLLGQAGDYITFDTVNTNIHDGLFLSKFSSSGQFQWAVPPVNDSLSFHTSITVRNNNLFLPGGYNLDSSVFFGGDTLFGRGISIMKYDLNGNLFFIKNLGVIDNYQSQGRVYIKHIKFDHQNNIIIAGQMDDGINDELTTLTIGSFQLSTLDNWDDIFIAKYDSLYNPVWAKKVGGIKNDEINDITLDSYGNIYLTGYFMSPVISFDSITLNKIGTYDPYIVKYDSNGNVLWALNFGGIGPDFSDHVVCDNDGNIYLSGDFENDTLHFSSFSLIDSSGNSGAGSSFLVKLDSSGNSLWGKSYSHNTIILEDMVVDSNNNILITGLYNGTTFISCYNSSGDSLWTVHALCGGSKKIASDVSRNIVIAGTFGDSCVFGADTIVNVLPGGMWEDIFIAKLSNSGSGVNFEDDNNSISIFPNPSSEFLSIIFKKNISDQTKLNIVITDISGRIIQCTTIRNKDLLNISSLPSGIYIIKVINNNDVAMGKFIKQ